MRDATAELQDGRVLAYLDLGDPTGTCVWYFHGAPSCRLAVAPFDEAFRWHGVRVVAPDRPGYGGSSPQPGRRLADWPTDVLALADALGVARFAVAGHSSGGPYALVCAALLSGRVTAAATIAGVTDMAWPGALEGYDDLEIALMRAPDEAAALAEATRRCGADGSGFLEAPTLEPSAPDLAFLTDPDLGVPMAGHFAEAFRQGITGYAQDVFVQGRPWPFDPATITVPVQVLHGDADAMVPLDHSRHTAEVVPGAQLHVLPGHGHLSIMRELPTWFARLG